MYDDVLLALYMTCILSDLMTSCPLTSVPLSQSGGVPGGASGVPADESGLRGRAGDGTEAVRDAEPRAPHAEQPATNGTGELQGTEGGGGVSPNGLEREGTGLLGAVWQKVPFLPI